MQCYSQNQTCSQVGNLLDQGSNVPLYCVFILVAELGLKPMICLDTKPGSYNVCVCVCVSVFSYGEHLLFCSCTNTSILSSLARAHWFSSVLSP